MNKAEEIYFSRFILAADYLGGSCSLEELKMVIKDKDVKHIKRVDTDAPKSQKIQWLNAIVGDYILSEAKKGNDISTINWDWFQLHKWEIGQQQEEYTIYDLIYTYIILKENNNGREQ